MLGDFHIKLFAKVTILCYICVHIVIQQTGKKLKVQDTLHKSKKLLDQLKKLLFYFIVAF